MYVSISDNGVGIPKKLQEKIKKGYSTKTLDQGTGLDLPMCYRFLKMNKAKLNFTSQENKGTKFTLVMMNKKK